MKRFIITSLCTLGLSLLGAFGINQNNSANELYTVSNTSNVNQDIADGEEQQNLPIDNITLVTDNVAKDTKENAEAVTPQTTGIEEKEVSNQRESLGNSNTAAVSQTDGKQDTTASVSDKSSAAVQTAVTNNTATNPVIETKAAVQKSEVLGAAVSNNSCTKNTSVNIYKNVDLSQCNSVQDVVSELQKNGCTNITSSNIQNISSLQDILKSIQKSGTSTAPTAKPTQAPTSTPAPTAKPTQAPTSKPVPTVKPTQAPASTPAPTAKPTQTPTKAPTPTTKPSTSTSTSGISNYANQVLQLVNQERAKAGLSAYTTNSTLAAAANKRAQETVQSFSHTRPNGTSFSTVLQEYSISFRAAGENIAYGQKTPQEVVTGWMNSPGHRANILNANFNKIGIGVYQSNGVIYWSQLFTN